MQEQALTDAIVAKSAELSKCRRRFLSHVLLLLLSINHGINFTQLARHSSQYCDRSMRLNFEVFTDFASVNLPLVQQHGSGHFILALDPTYLPKSGKKTPGLGRYWSGVAQKALWGLEATLLSVVDVDKRTAWHLDADAYFAKARFIDRICSSTELQVVSRLRKDARLRYLYTGPRTGKQGRPRQYAGRIDLSRPDFDYFTLSHQDEQVRVYSAIVNCPFLKRNVKLAYTQYLDEHTSLPTHYKLYFSTDLNLPAWMIVKYYCLRYQQEFLIRDANGAARRQFTGLADCQGRSANKIDYHATGRPD